MTLVSIKKVEKIDSMRRRHESTCLVLKCDDCNREFEKSSCPNIVQFSKKEHHFCSKDCINRSKKFGIIKQKTETTCIERFGATSPLSSKECIVKGRQRMLEEHGVDMPQKLDSVKEKREQTCLKKFGKTTFLATIENRNILNSDVVYEKRKRSLQTMDFMSRNKKRHETMKKRGSYKTSKREEAIYRVLTLQFGQDSVDRQVYVNRRWHIDFYVNPIKTFIQFDGVYWHGLDRSLDEICLLKSPRDVIILKKYNTDREQDQWFAEQKLKLVRITDHVWNNDERFLQQLIASALV